MNEKVFLEKNISLTSCILFSRATLCLTKLNCITVNGEGKQACWYFIMVTDWLILKLAKQVDKLIKERYCTG